MNRIVMVTGAASGIGAGIAERFLTMRDQVIAVDKDETSLAPLMTWVSSGDLLPSIADATDGAQVKKALNEAIARLDPPEVLVNNAGTTGGPQAITLHVTPPDAVDNILDVNFRAIIRLCAAVLPAMLERGRGVIVNIASAAGFVAFAARAAYSISKAAVIQITRTIAADYGWQLAEPALREQVLARIPQRRIGTVSDISVAVTFFASEEAGYCNGAAIPIGAI